MENQEFSMLSSFNIDFFKPSIAKTLNANPPIAKQALPTSPSSSQRDKYAIDIILRHMDNVKPIAKDFIMSSIANSFLPFLFLIKK